MKIFKIEYPVYAEKYVIANNYSEAENKFIEWHQKVYKSRPININKIELISDSVIL